MKNCLYYLCVVLVLSMTFVSCEKSEDILVSEENPEIVIDENLPVELQMPQYDITEFETSVHLKYGWNGHKEIAKLCAQQWGLTGTRVTRMMEGANAPDTKDNEGVVPGTQQWRHGYVFAYGVYIWGTADQWCYNVIKGTGIGGNSWYTCFSRYPSDKSNGDYCLGYAGHYMMDLTNPWHCAANIVSQANHGNYEKWIEANWWDGWQFYKQISTGTTYYAITDPAATCRSVAKASYNVSASLNNAYNASGSPIGVGTGNSTLVSMTRTQITIAGKYMRGLIKYTLDAKSAW
jgi:hypothetical protein